MKLPTIKKNREFRYIYSHSRSVSDKNLILYKHKKRENNIRFGISISSKVGNAVVRNRLKRQLKEILRNNIDSIRDEYDIIFVVRVRCRDAGFDEIEKSVFSLMRKLSLTVKQAN